MSLFRLLLDFVPQTPDYLEITGVRGVNLNFFTQMADMYSNHAAGAAGILIPDAFIDLRGGKNSAGVFHQQLDRRAVRVSMGTVFQIPWTYLPDGWPEPSMGWLRAQGFRTVAMALRDDSVPLNDPRLLAEERLAIVLGTEGDGLAQATIDACDYTVRIPMSHGVDSLNVAAASAVAFYQLGLQ